MAAAVLLGLASACGTLLDVEGFTGATDAGPVITDGGSRREAGETGSGSGSDSGRETGHVVDGSSQSEAGGGSQSEAGGTSSGPDSGREAGTSSGTGTGSGSGFDAGSSPPSCEAGGLGKTNCGASNESCCTSPEVTGATFYRTYANTTGLPVGEADDATVSDFRLDRYLVTVGRFRAFVGAWSGGTGYLPAGGSGKHTHLNGGKGLVLAGATSMYEPGWSPTYDAQVTPTSANLTSCQSGDSTWTDLAGGGHENLPINCVDWAEAYAFCIWDGGFLPSESEWEYAAAGGSDQREYPWGQADPGTTNQYAIYGCNYGGGGGTCATIASIAPVGAATAGAGLWTQLDLVGDLLVWNLDWYASAYDACVDCVYPTPGSLAARVVRGADFTSTGGLLYPAVRSSQPPADRERVIGFRCARVP